MADDFTYSDLDGDQSGDISNDDNACDDGSQGADTELSADSSAADTETYDTGGYGITEYANAMGIDASGDTDIQGVWHDGETLTLGEKWQSLKAAGGGFLMDVYDTTASFIDEVVGDDKGADRHYNASEAEGMAFRRHLREAFQGKRILSSREEDWVREHGREES